MGRRPMGRKYPKHISIQVKEEHNEDLKLLAAKLSDHGATPTGKNWTIRDIILTLLYAQYNNPPEWFVNNHFEKWTDQELQRIRKNIRGSLELTIKRNEKVSTVQKDLKQKSPPKLRLKLNPKYENYLGMLNQIKQEESK
jgi:hypothetical protein